MVFRNVINFSIVFPVVAYNPSRSPEKAQASSGSKTLSLLWKVL